MFDPYRRWLGIPEGQRPPTYYQLLGIARDESDPEVIASAALRQAAFVRNFQAGEHAAVCARVLGELALARAALSDSMLRSAYDAALRDREPASPVAVSIAPPLVVAERPVSLKSAAPRRRRGTAFNFAAYLTLVSAIAALGVYQASKTPLAPTVPAPSEKPTPVATFPTPGPTPTPPPAPTPSPREVAMVAPPEIRTPLPVPKSASQSKVPKVAPKPPVEEDETPALPDDEEEKAADKEPPPAPKAIANRGDDEASRAEAFLNDKGLQFDKGRFVLPEEEPVLERFATVKAAGDLLKRAQGDCNQIMLLDDNLRKIQAMIPIQVADIQNLQIEMQSLPAPNRRSAEQNLMFANGQQNLKDWWENLNTLRGNARSLEALQAGFDARRDAQNAYDKALADFSAKAADFRPYIVPVAAKYAEARADPDIKAALLKVRPYLKAAKPLGPSKRFEEMVKYLNGPKAASKLKMSSVVPKAAKAGKK